MAELSRTDGCITIDGPSVDVVYPQLVATVGAEIGELTHVISRIERSPELEQIAPLYPGFAPAPGTPEAEGEPTLAGEKREEGFRDLVAWWQYPSLPLNPWDQPAFTHGSRTKTFDGHFDQVQSVVESLEADETTSRGIIVLLNPPADRVSADIPFPSFRLVQFQVRRPSKGSPALDCTAYFRKQEVRYWWLVNLAELAQLQRQICDGLSQRPKAEQLRTIRPGSITTIAARAHAGEGPPKVRVPRIDRYYVLERERLLAMVNSVIWEQMPDRKQYADDWLRLLFELNPPETPDPDGLAIAQEGVKCLRDQVEHHLESEKWKNDQQLKDLHHALEKLLAANQEFALRQKSGKASSEQYADWRRTVNTLTAKLLN